MSAGHGGSWPAGLAGLGVLAALVPSPVAVLRTLGGSRTAIDGDAATVAALAVAAIVVWTALGMAAVIGATVLLARLPGSTGAIGRAVLARLLPRRWQPWIGALAGMALLSGVAACGTGVAAADPGTPAAAVADSGSNTVTTPILGTPILGPTTTAAGPLLDINGLDWPTGAASHRRCAKRRCADRGRGIAGAAAPIDHLDEHRRQPLERVQSVPGVCGLGFATNVDQQHGIGARDGNAGGHAPTA